MDMVELVNTIAVIVSAIITWIGQFLAVITDNALLLMFVVLSVTGIAVGFIRRLMRL